MATALDPFSMFMLTTGPAFLKDDESIINAVTRNSYLIPRFLEGKEMELLLQGGTQIQDILYLEEDSDAEFYKASEQDFDYRNQQVGTAYKLDWRFLKNSTSWTDHEVGLNEGGSLSDRIGRFHRFKRYKRLKEMNLFTTTIHKIEDSLFTTPSATEMEAGDGALPHSLGSTITENVSGLPTGYTTVQTIAPSSKPNWDNQRGTYVGGAVTDVNFWDGCRRIWTKCRFERLPKYGAYSEPSRSPSFIACSLWGLRLAERSLQNKNDILLAGRQDPAYPHPMFNGTPFVYVSTLDTASLFTDTAGGAYGPETSVSGGANGPRFWFIQGRCVNLIWHRNRMFYKKPPFSPDRQPFMKVMVTDMWYNMVNQNRRENGILGPAANVTTPPA